MQKVSTIEMSEADVQAALLKYLQDSGEDLGTTIPAIILTSSGKGKGCTITASITLAVDILVNMGGVELLVLPAKPGVVEAFKKPATKEPLALQKGNVPKDTKELSEKLKEEDAVAATTQAQDVKEMVDVLDENIPVEETMPLEEEESPLKEDDPVVEKTPAIKTKPKSSVSTESLFANKQTVATEVEEIPDTTAPTKEAPKTDADSLFG